VYIQPFTGLEQQKSSIYQNPVHGTHLSHSSIYSTALHNRPTNRVSHQPQSLKDHNFPTRIPRIHNPNAQPPSRQNKKIKQNHISTYLSLPIPSFTVSHLHFPLQLRLPIRSLHADSSQANVAPHRGQPTPQIGRDTLPIRRQQEQRLSRHRDRLMRWIWRWRWR
jgi:hypothetical protein